MEDIADPRWGILIVLGALGALFLYNALAPSARRRWGWGRDGSAGPLSRWSYGIIGALLVCIALITGFPWTSPPAPLLVWLGVNLVAFFIAGYFDVRSNRG